MTSGHPSTQLELGVQATVLHIGQIAQADGSTWTRLADGRVVESRPATSSVAAALPNGHTELDVICPFCSECVRGRAWSLHGSGKRCTGPGCKATLGHNAGWVYHRVGTPIPGEQPLPAPAPGAIALDALARAESLEDSLWELASSMGAAGEYAYRRGVRDTLKAVRALVGITP